MSATHLSAEDLSQKRVRSYASKFLGTTPEAIRIHPLTPDASTRKYYRINDEAAPDKTFIVSLYANPFNPQSSPYLDVTRLFHAAGLPVPEVIDVAGTEGIILQEDLGDVSLAMWMQEADSTAAAAKLDEAIELIVRIQEATPLAFELGSVASTLAFDSDKLGWELNYFFDHFFSSYRGEKLSDEMAGAIRADLQSIADELADRPRVLTHRDYHAMNLMVDPASNLRIIDHQDSRMGPATYDLVPILVERRLIPADQSWVESKLERFLEIRSERGMPALDSSDFRYEFELMAVQRQLKAVGTFSYQSGVMGRGDVYEKYIQPAVQTVLRSMRYPGIKEYRALRAKLESVAEGK